VPLTPQELADLRVRVLAGERITNIETCREIISSLRQNRLSAAATAAEKKTKSGGKRKQKMTDEELFADLDSLLGKGKPE
jgi:predicted lactoylglutathione lyase